MHWCPLNPRVRNCELSAWKWTDRRLGPMNVSGRNFWTISLDSVPFPLEKTQEKSPISQEEISEAPPPSGVQDTFPSFCRFMGCSPINPQRMSARNRGTHRHRTAKVVNH